MDNYEALGKALWETCKDPDEESWELLGSQDTETILLLVEKFYKAGWRPPVEVLGNLSASSDAVCASTEQEMILDE